MEISKKRGGLGLEVKTIRGGNGTYLFFRATNGSYLAFLVVAAKDAARDCGAEVRGNTRCMCKEVWGRN